MTVGDDEFRTATDGFRRELLAYCYRVLGSVHDAEDTVQEVYLRAWRSYDGFEGRSSVRVWLYRIATNACLTALSRRERRPLPSGLGAPGHVSDVPATLDGTDLSWLEPFPDALLGGVAATDGDPAAVVATRDSVRLALVAALQQLPARQRVVLILRDVLAWSAPEVAGFLGTTTAAVKSALQRARAQLDVAAPRADDVVEPAETETRVLLDRYMTAFHSADIDGLMRLLRDDVEIEMPPLRAWLSGRDSAAEFFGTRVFDGAGRYLMVPTRANGTVAAAAYGVDGDGIAHAHGIHVLTARAAGIARITAFLDPGLFEVFGLPVTAATDSIRPSGGSA
ncbi:RNA polymerase ECF family sigma subunit [Haloactinopolyspora alba]|uniref:RNA polymerase ECF family sigma subunit n=1 Tax=Haloactinopolyspora alba TaxID=648780 RepID=A0A2P8E2A2_9ACTN|nr:sigma-70 family RNA polymerase sigma factor [Haloactinopolyspora alba]PSL03608.1 RNA polymerase ECF family sigma subunit [Haloactinopolyspora alba]